MTKPKPITQTFLNVGTVLAPLVLGAGSITGYGLLSAPVTEVLARTGNITEILYRPNILPPLSRPEHFAAARYSANTVGEEIHIRFENSARTITLRRLTAGSSFSFNACGEFDIRDSEAPPRQGPLCLNSYPAPLL